MEEFEGIWFGEGYWRGWFGRFFLKALEVTISTILDPNSWDLQIQREKKFYSGATEGLGQ